MMKKIIFFIKLTLDAIRDTRKIIKYFSLIQINGYLVIFKIFFVRFFYCFQYVRSKQSILITNKSNNFFYLEEEYFKVDDISKNINDIGYSSIFHLKNNYLKNIIDYIFQSKNIDIKSSSLNKLELLKKINEPLNDYFLRLNNLKVSRFTGTLNLHNNSLLKDLLLSEAMINLAKSYLNTNDFSVNASFFVSNPIQISETEKYQNAQYFHWDNDFKKFFKLYLYLTDVNDGSGPHIFIPGTHKKKLPSHQLCRLYSDRQIYSSYPEFKKFLGKAGSLFFVDSYGIHKGETPTSNSRLLLNVHYGKGKILYSKDDLYFNS
jgi:hypothetical protein